MFILCLIVNLCVCLYPAYGCHKTINVCMYCAVSIARRTVSIWRTLIGPGLVTLTFDLLTSKYSLVTRVMGFHPAKFGLPRPFCSRVMSRHATDSWTDRWTDGRTDNRGLFIMPPPIRGWGHNNTHCCTV